MLRIIAAALAALLYLAAGRGAGPGVSIEADQVRHPVRGGFGDRRAGPHRRPGTGADARSAHHRGPKPGADGALAASEVKRSPPDGYTFMFGTNSPLAVVPNMQKDPPYNVLSDFTPVTYLGDNTFFIVVHPSLPVKSLAELIAFAKASPKPLNYATGNTYAFVSMAMLATNNGIQLEAIRYKSEPDAITDLLSGRVQLMNGTSTSVLAHVKAGKLRALSTSFAERSPLMPDVPSLVEAGQPKFPIGPWFALVGPADLPPEIVATMNKAMVAALAKPNVREQMEKHGFIPKSSTPGELATYMKDQLAVWKIALKDAGIEPQ